MYMICAKEVSFLVLISMCPEGGEVLEIKIIFLT
jgi:hypothetical protein